jgi:hypothetical protein
MLRNKLRLSLQNTNQNAYDGTVIVSINIVDGPTPWKQAAQDEGVACKKCFQP